MVHETITDEEPSSAKVEETLEEPVVDPKNKTLATYMRNLGKQSIMVRDL